MKQPNSTRRALLLALGLAGLLILAESPSRRPARSPPGKTPRRHPLRRTADASPDNAVGSAFITINPEAGFPLDPFLVSVQAGGPVTASTVSEALPGLRLRRSSGNRRLSGRGRPLKVFFYSDNDTTLVVQTPDGDYLCNDNTSKRCSTRPLNQQSLSRVPTTSRVGNSDVKGLVAGFLVFTSHENVNAGTLALANLVQRPAVPEVPLMRERVINASQQLMDALAAVKSPDALEAGGDDVTAEITADGNLPAPELQTGDTLCNGLVSLVPDYVFDWTGETDALNLYVEAAADTTLLVVTPDKSVLCSDNSGNADNLNPLVTIEQPAEGRYLVWVGRLNPDKDVASTLTITEAADAQPESLQP